MAMGNDIKTPLYQKVGEDLHKVLVETSADQVLMKDAENGDSNVQAEIESLRESVKNVLAANDAMIFKGVVAAEGDIAAADYNAGWTYKVGVAGTYKGQKCEVGDLIVCVNDHAADGASDADWTVVQTNIDGAVTGPGNPPALRKRRRGTRPCPKPWPKTRPSTPGKTPNGPTKRPPTRKRRPLSPRRPNAGRESIRYAGPTACRIAPRAFTSWTRA